MSKLKSSFAAKAVAVFLLAVMGIVFVGSLIGVGMMADAGGYAGSANTLRERVLSSIGYSQLYQTFERLYNGYNPDYAQYRSGLAAEKAAEYLAKQNAAADAENKTYAVNVDKAVKTILESL